MPALCGGGDNRGEKGIRKKQKSPMRLFFSEFCHLFDMTFEVEYIFIISAARDA